MVERLAAVGLHHAGGPMLFYLWLCDDAGSDGWTIADRLARACSWRPATSTATPAPRTRASRSCRPESASNPRSTDSRKRLHE